MDEASKSIELMIEIIEGFDITVNKEIINEKKKELREECSKFEIGKKEHYKVVLDHFKYLQQNPGTQFGSYFDFSYKNYAPGLRNLVDDDTKFKQAWMPMEDEILRNASSDMEKDSTLTLADVAKDRSFGFRSGESCKGRKKQIKKDSSN